MEHQEAFCLGPQDRLFRTGLFQVPQKAGDKTLLLASKCKACGVYLFPPPVICPKCLARDQFEPILLGTYGKLFTYSVVRQGPPHYAKSIPYAIGYVDLDEGVRVFSQLAVENFDDLKIGLEMELFTDKLYTDAAGMNVIGYKFRPRTD